MSKVVFIDGENISNLDLAALSKRKDILAAKTLIYNVKDQARLKALLGFERVLVPNIGKESVDRAIAMDAALMLDKGVKDICLVSSDYDFGLTAAHLKYRFPKANFTILCDYSRVSIKYLNSLKAQGIAVEDTIKDHELDRFAQQVVLAIHGLVGRDGQLSLSQLGEVLREKGIKYNSLKKDLMNHGVIKKSKKSQGPDVASLTESAARSLSKKRFK